MMNRKLQYLIKWKDFGAEHNTWEPWDNLHAPELVADFHRMYLGAARRIRAVEFDLIKFKPVPTTIVPRCRFSRGGVDVRGPSTPNLPTVPTAMPAPKYVPPHRRYPSPYCPRPSIVTSSSHRLSVTVLSVTVLSITVLSSSHHPPRRTITLVPSLHSSLSAYLIILFFLWFHFYLLTPIYLYLYLYTLPFLAEIPIFSF